MLKPAAYVNNNRLNNIRNAHGKKRVERGQLHTDRMEDYLEVIYELIQQKGYATAIEISEYLNVSCPSVTKMVQRLYESKYLHYEKYRGISLTEEGISIAKNVSDKHGLLAEFFKMIGVDKDIANIDAEGIEHHLHPVTLKKLQTFINTVKDNSVKETPH